MSAEDGVEFGSTRTDYDETPSSIQEPVKNEATAVKKSAYVSMYACRYVCMYVYMYVCMYVCMYACMYVRTYVCMYVCLSIISSAET